MWAKAWIAINGTEHWAAFAFLDAGPDSPTGCASQERPVSIPSGHAIRWTFFWDGNVTRHDRPHPYPLPPGSYELQVAFFGEGRLPWDATGRQRIGLLP
jgi:hypothetical protein